MLETKSDLPNQTHKNSVSSLNEILDSKTLHHFGEIQTLKKIRKLLIIDDDIDMSSAMSEFLKDQYACKVDIAADPFEAMNCMAESYYDLIVLDWKLPVFTGEQTLQHAETDLFFEPSLSIKWDSEKVPVVIISSSEREKCALIKTKHFNCVGFISKIQPIGKIFERLSEYIENKKNLNSLIA